MSEEFSSAAYYETVAGYGGWLGAPPELTQVGEQNNIGLRPAYTRTIHDLQRPEDRLPTSHRDIMCAVQKAYKRHGLIRNTLDLMSEFGCAGIQITHPQKNAEEFLQYWFKDLVKGPERSERFLNNLFRFANITMRRYLAKVTRKSQVTGKIPVDYYFFDPRLVDVINDEVRRFSATIEPQYGLVLPNSIQAKLKEDTPAAKELRKQLGEKVTSQLVSEDIFALDPINLLVFHYKKDDWDSWSLPMLYSILDDVRMLEKHKLLDFTALDSAARPIRLWKLGSMEYRIVPNSAAFAKIRDALTVNTGAGPIDIMWGPDLELVESKPVDYKVFAKEKYEASLANIYTGLGVSPSLTGGTTEAGASNNMISIKTMIKRLICGREILTRFWMGELAIVQEEMGFSPKAEINFHFPNLGDEEAEKKLFIDLADRNIVSNEWILERFGANPKTEHIRLNREYREIDERERVPRSGPWFDPEWENKLKTDLVKRGAIKPSQIGVDIRGKVDVPSSAPPGESNTQNNPERGRGRPKNSRDVSPRKRRQPNPVVKAKLDLLRKQKEIVENFNPVYLSMVGKSSLRELSHSEFEELERLRFLFLEAGASSSEELALAAQSLDIAPWTEFSSFLSEVENELGRQLNAQERASLQIDFLID